MIGTDWGPVTEIEQKNRTGQGHALEKQLMAHLKKETKPE